jgi:sugar lactone lactonase YvrE
MPQVKKHKASLLCDHKSILGEGPVWDQNKGLLFWVDIEGCKLHGHNPSSKENYTWNFEEMIGAAVPMEDGDMLLGMESGLASFNFATQKTTLLGVLENENPKMRMNDGKVDPLGNFWIGTMHKEFKPNSGNLFRIDKGYKTTLQIPKTTISNGMGWSPDHKWFYFIDTAEYVVCRYAYDVETGDISDKKVLFEIPKSYGGADGMCIDAEGMLWIAHWGGFCVRRWDPTSAEVIEIVEVNAPHVTSCCFGGKNLNTLYITTARSGLTQKQLKNSPLSGGLFTHKSKVKGIALAYFKN